ncbi:hypothetical protein AB0D83_20215 [Streptomyces decoyicus]|uniref:hypothetical protein n=1 Tax=Streptomyces decoyicus TaxID=249567 RepID=UPI0033F2D50D
MKVARSLGVIAASAALAFTMSTESYAAGTTTLYTGDAAPGGRAKFTSDGDVLTVCDLEADGWAVTAGIGPDAGSATYTLKRGGTGNCATAKASDGGSHDLKEGKGYLLKVCLYQGSTVNYCRNVIVTA